MHITGKNSIRGGKMEITEYLKSHGIMFVPYEHTAVFTCEEAEKCREYQKIRGVHSKNLFLKDRKGKRFYLVILPVDKKLELSEIERISGGKIKFANEEELQSILGLTRGAVSPFGLINDAEHKVTVYIDKIVWEAEYVSFHPNVNTKTLELEGKGFHKYLESVGNKFLLI